MEDRTLRWDNTHIPVDGGEERVSFDLLHAVRTCSWNRVHHSLFPSQYNKPWPSAFIHTTGDLPKRFDGFLLKSIRKRLCASRLRNCGIPSFALRCRNKQERYQHFMRTVVMITKQMNCDWVIKCLLLVLQFASQSHFYMAALIKDLINQASHRLPCFNMQPHLLKNHVHSLVPVFSLER